MPSLIYIARISSFSEELAKTLRSAGCHVKSFKPGDITDDECLLAMTSEAVASAFCPDGQKVEPETPAAATLAGPDLNAQLGSQAAVWNSIKKAVATESQANRQLVAPVASAEEPKADHRRKPYSGRTADGRKAAGADGWTSPTCAGGPGCVAGCFLPSPEDPCHEGTGLPGIPKSFEHGGRITGLLCGLPWLGPPPKHGSADRARGQLSRAIRSRLRKFTDGAGVTRTKRPAINAPGYGFCRTSEANRWPGTAASVAQRFRGRRLYQPCRPARARPGHPAEPRSQAPARQLNPEANRSRLVDQSVGESQRISDYRLIPLSNRRGCTMGVASWGPESPEGVSLLLAVAELAKQTHPSQRALPMRPPGLKPRSARHSE